MSYKTEILLAHKYLVVNYLKSSHSGLLIATSAGWSTFTEQNDVHLEQSATVMLLLAKCQVTTFIQKLVFVRHNNWFGGQSTILTGVMWKL